MKLFLRQRNCAFCHSGPAFTNGAFHDAAAPYFTSATRVDSGRHDGLKASQAIHFTLAGFFSDDPEKRGAWAVSQVRPLHSDFGTCRGARIARGGRTAPCMHNGSLADLQAVAQNYKTLDLDRLHVDGEAIQAPLGLSTGEVDDRVQFLLRLSDDQP